MNTVSWVLLAMVLAAVGLALKKIVTAPSGCHGCGNTDCPSHRKEGSETVVTFHRKKPTGKDCPSACCRKD